MPIDPSDLPAKLRMQAESRGLSLFDDAADRIEKLEGACKDANEDIERVIERIEQLEAALRGLIDDEPCWLDHHGYCQAHGLSNPCEMAIARTALSP